MRIYAQSNTPNPKKSNVTAFRVNLVLFSLILISGLVYIFSINAMATQGFRTKKLTSDLANLETQHKKLELQNSTLQSVATIQEDTSHLNFVPASNITYLKDDNFALK